MPPQQSVKFIFILVQPRLSEIIFTLFEKFASQIATKLFYILFRICKYDSCVVQPSGWMIKVPNKSWWTGNYSQTPIYRWVLYKSYSCKSLSALYRLYNSRGKVIYKTVGINGKCRDIYVKINVYLFFTFVIGKK